jgi:hypothetical protein
MNSLPRLFRYMSLAGDRADRVRSVIVDRALYFASPGSLNDPFELRFQYSARGSRGQWREVLSQPEVRAALGLPRWGALTDYAVDLYASQASANSVAFGEAFRALTHSDVAVCCLSEKRDDVLMWSHYADGHKGVCLEFTPAAGGSLFAEAEPIQYQEEYPNFDYFSTTKDERGRLIFLTKSKRWAYEAEWRVVDVKGGAGIRYYALGELTGVVLGAESDSRDESRIRSWIAKSGSSIALYRAVRQPDAYALEVIALPTS